MSTKTNRGLGAFITLSILLVVGAFFIAKAIETKEVVKEVEEKTAVLETWYFTGSDPSDASHYEKSDGSPINCPTPNETVCSLLAPEDNNNLGSPDMEADVVLSPTETESVNQRIEAALASPVSVNETVISLRSQ